MIDVLILIPMLGFMFAVGFILGIAASGGRG